jgi:peptidyl-prolyl cis-trans isomerase B (cyclophilin B)
MGRKKLLKLQRKEEKKQEVFHKKESKKKMAIRVVFLALLVFGVYQINIAMNNNVNNNLQNEPIQEEKKENKIAVIETDKGNIKLELFINDAPKTVENFVKLASENFYDGIRFHRVFSNFMIQGGDPISKGIHKEDFVYDKEDNPNNLPIAGTGGPGYKFEDEINSHKVEVGFLAMANSGPNTNGSQFFIVTEKAQPHLDGKHTVFGKVIEGMEVVRNIKQGDVMNKIYVVE